MVAIRPAGFLALDESAKPPFQSGRWLSVRPVPSTGAMCPRSHDTGILHPPSAGRNPEMGLGGFSGSTFSARASRCSNVGWRWPFSIAL
jgi:hypothetical protein